MGDETTTDGTENAYAEAVDSPPEVEVPPGGEVVTPTAAPDPSDATEMIVIFDPSTEGNATADVTREAYRETWAAKGFREVVGTQSDGSLVLAPAEKLDPEGEGSTGSTVETSAQADATTEASAGLESDTGPRGRRQ